MTPASAMAAPADAADERLWSNVHPPDWISPEPRRRYHLVVVGGGTAGLVSAIGAAALGARVALVERALLGGDCLVAGCVPSKAIIRSARAAADARRAGAVGVRVAGIEADFGAIMRRMRERRADISPHDSAARLRSAGVDVYFGEAHFTSRSTIEVGGRVLRFRRAVIATGGRPAVPPIPGLASVRYLTTETLFALTELPRRLAVVGAGPVGCEMAQAFARLGSAVTLVDQVSRVLPLEDEDAAALVAGQMSSEGVALALNAVVAGVRQNGGEIAVRLAQGGVERELVCDELLVATGRAPNVDRLDLAAAGVGFDGTGVIVDDRLRTSNLRVFAAGDVCSPFKFTHAADAAARIVIQNALFFGRARASALVIPWCTYTDPEVAHVGRRAELGGRRQVETITIPLAQVDRAVIDEEPGGFVRIHHARGRMLGCTVVSSRAGEMIGLAADALRRGAGLDDLGATIHPYPTLTSAFRAAGDVYRRSRLTPRVRALLQRYFRLF